MSDRGSIVNVARRLVVDRWGGTESVIFGTGHELQNLGYRVEIQTTTAMWDKADSLGPTTPSHSANASPYSETIDGISVHRHPYFYPYIGVSARQKHQLDLNGGNLVSFGLGRSLYTLPRPRVLHLHTQGRLGGFVRWIARRRNIPYVVSVHGGVAALPLSVEASINAPTDTALDLGKPIGALVGSRHVIRDAALVLCPNQAEADALRQRHPDTRIEWFPNGVDIDRFSNGNATQFRKTHGIPEDHSVFAAVGSFYDQKNQLLALRALKIFLKTTKDVCLVLIGASADTAYRKAMDEFIEREGLSPYVRVVTNATPQNRVIADALAAARAVISPSRYETFGIVVLEAWAATCPVIVPDVGGFRDIVAHNRNGLVYPPDDPNALATQMLTLTDQPDRAEALARAGHQDTVQRYQWKEITRRLAGLYEEVSP